MDHGKLTMRTIILNTKYKQLDPNCGEMFLDMSNIAIITGFCSPIIDPT